MQKKKTEKENIDKKQKNIPFYKQLLMSIKDFDKYESFGMEKTGQAILYIIKLIAIFTLISTAISTFKFSNTLNSTVSELDNKIYNLEYNNGTLSINNNEKLELNEFEETLGKIIIDTSDLTNEQIEEYKNNSYTTTNYILLLKDKFLVKTAMVNSINESSYEAITQKDTLNKGDILDYFNKNQILVYTTVSITMYIYMLIIYMFSVLMDALILGALGYITARIAKLKIRYMAILNMAIHALTLPIILNMIYVIINGLTGYVITYFQIMYTAISYIYMITAIFIIKSDYIKRQNDLQKIQSEQEKIKQELLLKSEEEKEKKEQEKEKKERKEKDKKKEKKDEKSSEPTIGEKPEGNNA